MSHMAIPIPMGFPRDFPLPSTPLASMYKLNGYNLMHSSVCHHPLVAFGPTGTLTFDLLTSKPKQFIVVPRDKSLAKIHQCIPEISQKQIPKIAFLAHLFTW